MTEPTYRICMDCLGTGRKRLYMSSTYIKCPECDGTGRVRVEEEER